MPQAVKHMALVCLVLLAVYGFWVLMSSVYSRFSGEKKRKRPFVSILVVAGDDEARIEGIIRQLLKLDYFDPNGQPQFEVVAISRGSKDDTPVILERLARTKARLVTKRATKAQVYQEGLDLCQGEIILLLDLTHRHQL
jgi:hypothetical protein